MAAYNNLDTLAEQAVAALVDASAFSGAVLTGVNSDSIVLPCCVISSEGGEEMPYGSGNFWQSISVKYFSNSDSTSLATHKTNAAGLFDVFITGALASDLGGIIADFGVIGVRNFRFGAARPEDRKWISELTFDMLSCATDFTGTWAPSSSLVGSMGEELLTGSGQPIKIGEP
jgi:hypothetical protein